MDDAVKAAIYWKIERKYSFEAHTSNKRVKFYVCKYRSTTMKKKGRDTISSSNDRDIGYLIKLF
jgi:hypothetical protein